MRITQLLWDDETVEHLAEHGVHPRDAEEVLQRRPYALRTRKGRYLVLGQNAEERYLTLVIQPLGGQKAKLITARAMTDVERRHYARR